MDVILIWNKSGFTTKDLLGAVIGPSAGWWPILFFHIKETGLLSCSFYFTTLCTVKPFNKKGIINHKKLILNLLHE